MTVELERCPVPMFDGADCWQEPEQNGIAGICTEHMRLVSDRWLEDAVEYDFRCPTCRQLSVRRVRGRTVLYCQNPLCNQMVNAGLVTKVLDAREEARPSKDRKRRAYAPADSGRRHSGVVYYLSFGDRIKIGTSVNLPRRLKAIPHDECLAVERGSFSTEAARHLQFADQRVPGQQEWFLKSRALVAHINELRAANGRPMAAWREWQRGGVKE